MSENIKHFVDGISVATVAGTLAQILPPIAALLTIIWTVLRLIEMWTGKTISDLRKKKNENRTDS